jgi:hypothetical protein
MRNPGKMTLDEVLALACQLTLADQARLVARLAPNVERALDQMGSPAMLAPRQPLSGLLADLGPAPSAEDIDEARRAMWGAPDTATDSNRQHARAGEERVREPATVVPTPTDKRELEAAIERIISEIERAIVRMQAIQKHTEELERTPVPCSHNCGLSEAPLQKLARWSCWTMIMDIDEKRQRYELLRERRWPGGLTDAEQAELAALTRELCEHQDAAMAAANELMAQEIAALEAEAARLEVQYRQLRECLSEGQDLLARARTPGADVRADVRQLRERFDSVLPLTAEPSTREPSW